MLGRIGTFERIAEDLKIVRIKDEDDLSFCSRVAYSASRYWISAFCMDDGQGGRRGVTSQVLGRRLGHWLDSLDSIMPGIAKELGVAEGGVRTIYGRLADVGDIIRGGEQGRYLARVPRLEPLTSEAALALGFFEPAMQDFSGLTITGGLATLVLGHFEEPERRLPWWETDLPVMPWSNASDYGELRYINPETNKWVVSHPDVWTADEPRARDLTLARCADDSGGPALFFAVRKRGSRIVASRIDKKAAQELMNYIKKEAGKPVHIVFEGIDYRHSRAFLPISVLPSQIAPVIDALSWPSSSAGAKGGRLFRKETVKTVRELLDDNNIESSLKGMGAESDARREQRRANRP